MVVHWNNITQTDDHHSTCELFWSSYDPNQNRSKTVFQTFDIGLFILSFKRTTKRNPQSTKDDIATILNPFMPGDNKKAYILK